MKGIKFGREVKGVETKLDGLEIGGGVKGVKMEAARLAEEEGVIVGVISSLNALSNWFAAVFSCSEDDVQVNVTVS